MDIEDRLAALMEDAAASPPLDPQEVLRAGRARGVLLRRRQRTMRSAMAVVAVVAVGTGLTEVMGGHGGPSPGTMAAAAQSGTTTRPPGATPSSTPRKTMKPESIETVLKGLIPQGNRLSMDPETPPQLQNNDLTVLRDDDGHGSVQVTVSVTPAAEWHGSDDCSAGIANEGKRPPGALPTSCANTTLADGDRLMSAVTGVDEAGFYDAQVRDTRTDWLMVDISFANGYTGMNPPVTVTRAVPPLSLAQITAIVTSPAWEAVVQLSSTPTPTPAPISLNPTTALQLLRSLMPTGTLSPITDEHTSGLLDVTDSDGLAPAEVMVFVDPATSSGMDPIWCGPELPRDQGRRPEGAPPASCKTSVLPNGDKAMVQVTATDPNGYYSYRIIVDKKDGIDVEIQATNGNFALPVKPARAKPPLTPNEWLSIADNPGWH